MSSVHAAVSLQVCSAEDESCEKIFEGKSCTEVISEYSFSGTCCSLSDGDATDGAGGCVLTVTGATKTITNGEASGSEATCSYEEKECPSCCETDDEGNEISCVAPNMETIFSSIPDECPESIYNPFQAGDGGGSQTEGGGGDKGEGTDGEWPGVNVDDIDTGGREDPPSGADPPETSVNGDAAADGADGGKAKGEEEDGEEATQAVNGDSSTAETKSSSSAQRRWKATPLLLFATASVLGATYY